VGNRDKIRIWRDRWLPSPHSNMVHTPSIRSRHEARVSELIDSDSNWWNVQLVESLFPRDIAEQICGMADEYQILYIWTP
jgi:hypothetical protein